MGLTQGVPVADVGYSLSKAALVKLTRDLATEWACEGITVNCICPGLIRSAGTQSVFFDDPTLAAAVAKVIPLGRGGQPEEIAGQVVLCAAPAGAFLTGQAIAIDGGSTSCRPDPLSGIWNEAV